jgi:acetyl esterase/lipase
MLLLWCASIFQPLSIQLTTSFPFVDLIRENLTLPSLNGFYLGLGLLLLTYFWRGTKYLKAATILTFAFFLNNIINIINHGFTPISIIIISITILAIIAFGWIIHNYPTPRNFMDEVHPDFRKSRFISFNFDARWKKKLINKYLRDKYKKASVARNIKITDYEIKGYEGRNIQVQVFEKKDAKDNSPCMIVFPGGAFWAEPLPAYKYFFNRYINGTDMKVVFVHCTLSLEAPYPAAPEDCYLASLWTHENAKMLGINKAKIAVYGISTGGTLAASVCIMLRDRKQFKPCFQMLIYPLIGYELNTASSIKYLGMPVWKEGVITDGFGLYMKGHKGEIPAYASPINAKDSSNLPNAYIEVAEYDCVRDEAEMYANKLREHDIHVQFHEVKGAVHGFDISLFSKISRDAFKRRIKILNTVFNE